MNGFFVRHNGNPGRVQPCGLGCGHHFRLHKPHDHGVASLPLRGQLFLYPQAESRVPGRGVVDSLHNFGIERIVFDKLQLLRQLAVKPIGRIARAVRKARVSPMREAARPFLPAPHFPDNLLAFRGAGIDDNLPAHHAAFAAFRGQPFPLKLCV